MIYRYICVHFLVIKISKAVWFFLFALMMVRLVVVVMFTMYTVLVLIAICSVSSWPPEQLYSDEHHRFLPFPCKSWVLIQVTSLENCIVSSFPLVLLRVAWFVHNYMKLHFFLTVCCIPLLLSSAFFSACFLTVLNFFPCSILFCTWTLFVVFSPTLRLLECFAL